MIFPLFMMLISIAVLVSTTIKFNLTAGPVSVEDYNLFANLLNKPYGKFG